jgi:hypothetical protein
MKDTDFHAYWAPLEVVVYGCCADVHAYADAHKKESEVHRDQWQKDHIERAETPLDQKIVSGHYFLYSMMNSCRRWREYEVVAGWNVVVVADDHRDTAVVDIDVDCWKMVEGEVPMSENSDHQSDMGDSLQVVDAATLDVVRCFDRRDDCVEEMAEHNLAVRVKDTAGYYEQTPWNVHHYRSGLENEVDDIVEGGEEEGGVDDGDEAGVVVDD